MAKNIIITGCSSGFGWLMTQQLAKEGHTVYATMRNIGTTNSGKAEELRTWAAENKVNVIVTELDVAHEDSVNAAIKEIGLRCDGKIDVLINNAGIATNGLVEEYNDQQLDAIFETLVFGPNRMIRATLPYMHQHNSGLLILMSSRMSTFQVPFAGVYSAAKAAIQALAKTYHYELKSTGIDSVVIQVGSFKTSMGEKRESVEDSSVAQYYGDWYVKARPKVVNMFFTYSNPPQDTRQVTDLVSRIIASRPGERAAVYPVGLGVLESSVNEINKQSEGMSDMVMERIGL
jgi:NAD(P)-dependent dehydrogenase (short-subunit alcohol dehydrogenase family)